MATLLRGDLFAGYYMGGTVDVCDDKLEELEGNFKMQYLRGEYAAKYPKNSAAIVDKFQSYVQYPTDFPLPSCNLVRALNGLEKTRVSAHASHAAQVAANVKIYAARSSSVTDLFVAKEFGYALKALRQRAREAKRMPSLVAGYSDSGIGPDDWNEVENNILSLAEEYLME